MTHLLAVVPPAPVRSLGATLAAPGQTVGAGMTTRGDWMFSTIE